MPTDIELEPVTGKALQEFGRYQSVIYNLPKMVSLLVEPWYALVGNREQTLGAMRALILQLAFSHGPDHLQMIVVTSDMSKWDWVKWLPHFGDPRRRDAAGNIRMVYGSVREFGRRPGRIVRWAWVFHASARKLVGGDTHAAPRDHRRRRRPAVGVRHQRRRCGRRDVLRSDRFCAVDR